MAEEKHIVALTTQRYYCILNCVVNLFGKISAQPLTPLCIIG